MAKDTINLTDKDYKRKSFKTAPGGTYVALITAKSKIKPSRSGGGNNLNIHAKIVGGPHKGITFFDNIAPHVAWKVAQLLNAIGKKLKKLTLQQLLKLVTGKKLRVQLRQEKFQGRDQNKVVTWLPLKGKVTASDEDEQEEDLDESEDEENEEEAEDESEDEGEEEEEGVEDEEEEDGEEEESEDESEEEEEEDEEAAEDEEEEEEDDGLSPEDEEEEEGEESEEEEEEKPRRKRSKSKRAKKSKKKSRR